MKSIGRIGYIEITRQISRNDDLCDIIFDGCKIIKHHSLCHSTYYCYSPQFDELKKGKRSVILPTYIPNLVTYFDDDENGIPKLEGFIKQ
jgi:hypothetical protein